MKDPVVITFTMYGLLKYWAGLYKDEDAEKIKTRA
jgi:hypothetical protein